MPRKKNAPKGIGVPVRMRENSRLMHTHESMVDYLHGRATMGSLLNVFAPNFFGFNFARPLEDDLIYSDEYDDDDDNDDDDDDWFPQYADNRPRSPGMKIRELTDQEAEEILQRQKEEKEEEQKKQHKTERNKRKKMRKKEKKRLEKENAEKEDITEQESVLTPGSSVTQLQNPAIDSIANTEVANKRDNCKKCPNKTVSLGADNSIGNNKKIKVVESNKKEDIKQKESDSKLSCEASPGTSVPEEKCNQKPSKEKKREMIKEFEVQKNDKENTKILKKTENRKKEETHAIVKEKLVDPTSEEFARRSIELGGLGNRLAAAGQFGMAVKYITDAIKFNPTEYKLFGNRSLCYERLQQYENALSDADVALSMQPNWIKGLFRKGKALCGLKRYYEASLIYKEVLKLESSSVEAAQELKRAQTLHLMEMGFNWSQSSEALKAHTSLEAAVGALFIGKNKTHPQENGTAADQPVLPEEEDDEGEWTVLQSSRPRLQQNRKFEGSGERLPEAQLTLQPKSSVKIELFSVWVGTLRPSTTYMKLHDLFSRAGMVYSIKMLLEQECAFVNFASKEDSERAIECLNGVVVDGAQLTVRYPYKVQTGPGVWKSACIDPRPNASKECFFWRTTGCTAMDCSFKHIPEHKNMDRERFTSRLGNVGNQK